MTLLQWREEETLKRAISWDRIGCRAPALVLAALLVGCAATGPSSPGAQQATDLVLLNGKIVTVDRDFSIKQAVAIKDGKFLAVGSNDEIRRFAAPNTRTVDLKGRTVLPGLFDSHTHVIRGGRTWDLEVNWVNVKSLAEGLKLIADKAAKIPPGTWIRVVGGWHGSIEPGKLADLIVLSADYLTVPEDRIKELESVLTIVGGKPVYAAGEFARLAPR